MTVENLNLLRRLLAPAMAAAAAVTLAGCAATHIGEDWQCPPAQGTQCTSVAAADPMVKRLAGGGILAGERAGTQAPIASLGEGSHGVPGTSIEAGGDGIGRNCPPFCRAFRWFARLLETDAEGDAAQPTAAAAPAGNDSATDARADKGKGSGAADGPPKDAALRRPETVGRVWIAPFVDGDGVYREGAWVRIVIAPAAWGRP